MSRTIPWDKAKAGFPGTNIFVKQFANATALDRLDKFSPSRQKGSKAFVKSHLWKIKVSYISVLSQTWDSFFDGCNQLIIKSASADRSKAVCGHARLSFSVWTEQLCFLSHAKGESLFRPESMVTKEEHAIPWNVFGPVTWDWTDDEMIPDVSLACISEHLPTLWFINPTLHCASSLQSAVSSPLDIHRACHVNKV